MRDEPTRGRKEWPRDVVVFRDVAAYACERCLEKAEVALRRANYQASFLAWTLETIASQTQHSRRLNPLDLSARLFDLGA